ncbi:hypothetical protein DFQ12_0154 [Sphingobacterium detergens]|uniref:Uncharacterized protein n=1 Tax=Sphingobacterium detergens TaxID=1145106 RepID=A0A420BF44_SPHD1|nr:hypothetical protein DFQ12_0154 [Sphingobacterium detergens]
MKTIFVFLVSLLFAYPLFAQSDKLIGRWGLDFALTENNSLVPLDHLYPERDKMKIYANVCFKGLTFNAKKIQYV